MIGKIIRPVTILTILLLLNSCKDKITGPVELQPGRRDYTWTVDTLYSPMNYLFTIWGSSPQNVWTMGAGGTVQDRLFHFDGKSWTNYEVPPGCYGNVIYGFSADNFWIGGDDGHIWHYDGRSITLNFTYQPNGWQGVYIRDIYGTRSNDIYAVGVVFYDPQMFQRGFILHYDGFAWKKVYEANFYSSFGRIREENNNIYIYNYKLSYGINGAADTIEYDIFKGSRLEKIYSNTLDNIRFGSFNNIGSSVYFVISKVIYKYINNEFVEQFSFNNPNFGYNLYGRNDKDIFIYMVDGIAHYNGNDMEYLYKFTHNYTSVYPIIFNNEIFFCMWDPVDNVNMVLHGKLK